MTGCLNVYELDVAAGLCSAFFAAAEKDNLPMSDRRIGLGHRVVSNVVRASLCFSLCFNQRNQV